MLYLLTGGTPEQRKELAQTFRSAAISSGKGCLLLIAAKDGEHDIRNQLEKIIDGHPFKPGSKLADIKFKPDSVVIYDEDTRAELEAIEKMVPGFIDKHGPQVTIPFDISKPAAKK